MNIAGFQLGRQVTDGQFCKGYNAINLSNSKTVNIQVFDPSLLSNESFVKQFREVTHLLEVNNCGIMVPILQAEISQQSCYVIYDYFPNPQQLPPLPRDLTLDKVITLGLQLAQTLDHLHKFGVVHGGIENSSVYFLTNGSPALRPLMMQRVLPSLWPLTYDNLELKQRLYLAPEAKEKLSPATDFYALGVLLYQLLFDSPVTDDADCVQMEKYLQSIDQQSFEGISKNLDFFVSARKHRTENRSVYDIHEDSSTELTLQSRKKTIFRGALDINGTNLTPLFAGLLSPEAANRIHNYSQFASALQQCGIELPDIANTAGSGDRKINTRQDKESLNRTGVKWILTAAAMLATAVIGAVFFLLPENPVDVEVAVSNVPAALTSTTPSSSKIPALNQSADEVNKKPNNVKPQGIESLYQQALAQVEFNAGAALMSVNVILREAPDHSGALKLKRQIEENIEARSIIDRAEKQLAELKLVKPRGDNAYDSYQALAVKLSLDDDRVQQGFTHIAAAYFKQAEYLFQHDALDKAKQNVELGLYVKADYRPLIELGRQINDREIEKEKERNQKLTIARLEKKQLIDQQQIQLQQELKRKKEEQQRELEQQRLSEELKQRQQAQAEAEARKNAQLSQQQEEQKARDIKINNLLSSANGYLSRGQLKLDAVFAAHRDYEELSQLDGENKQVSRLKQDIIDAYSMLAGRYNDDELIAQALSQIEQGIQMSEQDRKKLEVRSRYLR